MVRGEQWDRWVVFSRLILSYMAALYCCLDDPYRDPKMNNKDHRAGLSSQGLSYTSWMALSLVFRPTMFWVVQKGLFLQKQNLAFRSPFHFIPPFFWNKFPTYHRSSLETADSYSFMGDVCPVFTSPPLIPPNWSCLQRDSVSTHRRRHRIRYLPLSPLNLNLVHTQLCTHTCAQDLLLFIPRSAVLSVRK